MTLPDILRRYRCQVIAPPCLFYPMFSLQPLWHYDMHFAE